MDETQPILQRRIPLLVRGRERTKRGERSAREQEPTGSPHSLRDPHTVSDSDCELIIWLRVGRLPSARTWRVGVHGGACGTSSGTGSRTNASRSINRRRGCWCGGPQPTVFGVLLDRRVETARLFPGRGPHCYRGTTHVPATKSCGPRVVRTTVQIAPKAIVPSTKSAPRIGLGGLGTKPWIFGAISR
jgi:hypothetical protein